MLAELHEAGKAEQHSPFTAIDGTAGGPPAPLGWFDQGINRYIEAPGGRTAIGNRASRIEPLQPGS